MGSTICAATQEITIRELPLFKKGTKKKEFGHVNDETTLRKLFPSYLEWTGPEHFLEGLSSRPFTDPELPIDGAAQRIPTLFNIGRSRLKLYGSKPIDFEQQEVELSYMSAVCLAVANRPALLERLKETTELTAAAAYCFNFHPTGQRQPVVVDDLIPGKKGQDIVYTKLKNGDSFWPLLVEKAWCKLLSGYQQARGLSPEDCFEEMTGVPAYSYSLLEKLDLRDYFAPPNCVFFIAKTQTPEYHSHQVVFLSDLENNQSLVLKSPCQLKDGATKDRERGKNSIAFSNREIEARFDLVTVGFFREGYSVMGEEISSRPRESVLYRITVEREEPVSIRFTQYYRGYLDEEHRAAYKYSPVCLEMFEQQANGSIEPTESGCFRAMGQARSVRTQAHADISSRVLIPMKGVYYLRVAVDWVEESIQKGRLLVYGDPTNVGLTRVADSTGCHIGANELKRLHSAMLSNFEFLKDNGSQTVFLNVEVRFLDLPRSAIVQLIPQNGKKAVHVKFDKCLNLQQNGEKVTERGFIVRFIRANEPVILMMEPADYGKEWKLGDIVLENVKGE